MSQALPRGAQAAAERTPCPADAAPAAPAAGPARTAGGFVLQIVAKLSYPVVILCAWHWDSPRYVGCMLFVLLWLQRVAGTGAVGDALRKLTPVDWIVAGVLNAVSVAMVIADSELLMRLYPSLVNFGLLTVFAATLKRGPSMIEKFAQITFPDPPAHVVRYTRRLTQLWSGFFLVNGVFSAYTALYWPREAWSLYNGAIAYAVVGVLLVAEIAWRKFVMLPRAARMGAK